MLYWFDPSIAHQVRTYADLLRRIKAHSWRK